MKSNTEQLKIAEKYLGESCPKCCSMSNNCCCYYVCKVFRESGNASLFYNGVTVTYCPNARKWCKANLAEIPLFIAMPSDVIFFDWENNGQPNHIGFVDHRYTDQQVCTLEGNTTSRYVVARRTREAKYIQGIYRPHFPTTYDLSKPLAIDGQFNYSSIAMLQKALGIKVDGILGRDTVKAMQKKVGVSQDGAWGAKTSKALQTMLKNEGFYKGAIDGCVYEGTVKALQQWCNKHASAQPTPQPTPKPTPTPSDKLVVDGKGGTATVKAMQKFFGTTQDGVISGQNKDLAKYYPSLEAVEFGKGGSLCVKKLQKWVGANEDGVLGQITVKLWQKKLGVTQDGCFGVNSMKAWQKYLNEHEKAVYPTPTPTPTPTPSPSPSKKVYLGQACSDYDKKAGDGSGKEVTKSAFKYVGSTSSPFNWTYVFRPKDSNKAEKAASMCEKAIANDNIGYSKNGETKYGKSKAMTKLAKEVNYDLSKIKVKCGLSCGDLVCLCNHFAGLSTCYIGSGLALANNLKKNGNFTCLPYKNGMALKRGDTIITAHGNGKNNHVAMIL